MDKIVAEGIVGYNARVNGAGARPVGSGPSPGVWIPAKLGAGPKAAPVGQNDVLVRDSSESAVPPGLPGRAALLATVKQESPATVKQESPASEQATSTGPIREPAPTVETPSPSPSLDELREKLYAVHVTNFPPLSGEMVAGAKHVDPEKQGKEPPSFRPTIHFSLGQMVAPHGRHSWDEKKFGVVLPLKALESQLANVSPHDSFIVGNLKLPPGAVVFVPEGTDTEGMPEHIQAQPYQGNLREAIDRHIQEQGGWSVKMSGVSNDDPAKIGQRDINTPEFFAALLQARPDLSFGSHISSEVGQAFRFGAIEQALVQFSRSFDPFGFPLSTHDAKFYRAFIEHNLERLPSLSSPEARRALEEKKEKLQGHLKVVDADLKFRKKGFSLSKTSEKVRTLAASLSFLGPLALPLLKSQLSQAREARPYVSTMVEALRCLPPDELREFERKNPELFQDLDLGVLHARYAVSRWLHQREDREGLETLLLEGLQKAREPLELLAELSPALKENSYRKETALSILRRPAVQMNLRQEEGMQFLGEGPRSVSDVIKAHPKAREGLTPWEPTGAAGTEADIELLHRLGRHYKVTPESTDSFKACLRTAERKELVSQRLLEELGQLSRPMNSLLPEEERQPGLTLGLLELLERDGIDGRPVPQEAWQSQMSLKEFAAQLS